MSAERAGRPDNAVLPRVLRATVGKLVPLLFRTKVYGLDRIPAGSGAILSGNHVSYADPVLLWCLAPRPVRFMGKAELWDVPVVGWVLSRVWAFPVRRGSADRAAIAEATGYLKDGKLVGVFPEGTRHRTSEGGLGQAQEGVAFMAVRAGVPIVPIGIAGTERIMPDGTRLPRLPRVTISVGEPIDPADYAHMDKRERLQAMTASVMSDIERELERARGRG